MPTQTKENYLKAIYFLELKHDEATITALSEEMGVSKPTVNNMIKKLAERGFIKYEKYKPLLLTEKGKKEAALIIRKHRLTEMFLVQIMGFGWEEVHSIAEEMEHLKSDEFFERMDQILGFPSSDPHGSPIPSKDGMVHEHSYKVFSSIPEGGVAILRAVKETSAALLSLLNVKNIQLGTEFTVMQVEPFDQTMVVSYGSHESVSLSYEVCKRLLVE